MIAIQISKGHPIVNQQSEQQQQQLNQNNLRYHNSEFINQTNNRITKFYSYPVTKLLTFSKFQNL